MKNILITFGTTIGITMLNLISGIITARLLGPMGKGELTAIILWPSMLSAIGSLGITESLVYYSGKDRNRIPQLFSCAMIFVIFQSIILMTAGYYLIPIFLKQYSLPIIQICKKYLLFIPLNLAALYQLSLLQGVMKFKKFNLIRITVVALYVLGICLLVIVGKITVINVAFMWLLSNLFTLILTFTLILKEKLLLERGAKKFWLPNKTIIKDLFSYGWRVHLGNISGVMNMKLDQMLMSAFLTPVMLGYYAISTTIAGIVTLIPNAFSFVAFPSITNKSEKQDKQRLYAKYCRFNIFLTAVVCVIVFLSTYWLIPFLYGEAYIKSIKPCQILTATMFFAGCSLVIAAGLKALGKPLVSSKAELIRLIVSVMVLPLLLTKFQIIGAAIATLIASFIGFIYLVRKSGLSLYSLFVPETGDINQIVRLLKFSKG